MARVQQPVWTVNVFFRDNNGKLAATSFYLPITLAYADAIARAEANVVLLDGVSDARIESFSMSVSFVEDSPVAPPVESEVQRKLRLSLDAGQFRNAVSLEVPSHIFAIEQAGTDVPNLGQVNLAALITALTQGGVGPGNGIVNWTGLDVTRLNNAEMVHRDRKSSRR